MVSRKNVGQPVSSAIRPAGATIRSRANAIRLVSSAYCVAEKRRLQRLIMKATNTAVTRPPLTFSMMISCVVGRDEAEVRDRLTRYREVMGDADDPLLSGTVDQAAESLRAYEAVGVERAMLQHIVHEDVEMVGLLGELAAGLVS